MLIGFGLSKLFWGEAVGTTTNLVNRSPSISINFNVLDVLWTQRSVEYSQNKIFDVQLIRQNISDLELRSLKSVSLDYQGKKLKGCGQWIKVREVIKWLWGPLLNIKLQETNREDRSCHLSYMIVIILFLCLLIKIWLKMN